MLLSGTNCLTDHCYIKNRWSFFSSVQTHRRVPASLGGRCFSLSKVPIRAKFQGDICWVTGMLRGFTNYNFLILQEEEKSVKKKSKHKKSKEKEESKEEKKKKKKRSKEKNNEIDELEAFLGGGASMSKPRGGGDYEEL